MSRRCADADEDKWCWSVVEELREELAAHGLQTPLLWVDAKTCSTTSDEKIRDMLYLAPSDWDSMVASLVVVTKNVLLNQAPPSSVRAAMKVMMATNGSLVGADMEGVVAPSKCPLLRANRAATAHILDSTLVFTSCLEKGGRVSECQLVADIPPIASMRSEDVAAVAATKSLFLQILHNARWTPSLDDWLLKHATLDAKEAASMNNNEGYWLTLFARCLYAPEDIDRKVKLIRAGFLARPMPFTAVEYVMFLSRRGLCHQAADLVKWAVATWPDSVFVNSTYVTLFLSTCRNFLSLDTAKACLRRARAQAPDCLLLVRHAKDLRGNALSPIFEDPEVEAPDMKQLQLASVIYGPARPASSPTPAPPHLPLRLPPPHVFHPPRLPPPLPQNFSHPPPPRPQNSLHPPPLRPPNFSHPPPRPHPLPPTPQVSHPLGVFSSLPPFSPAPRVTCNAADAESASPTRTPTRKTSQQDPVAVGPGPASSQEDTKGVVEVAAQAPPVQIRRSVQDRLVVRPAPAASPQEDTKAAEAFPVMPVLFRRSVQDRLVVRPSPDIAAVPRQVIAKAADVSRLRSPPKLSLEDRHEDEARTPASPAPTAALTQSAALSLGHLPRLRKSCLEMPPTAPTSPASTPLPDTPPGGQSLNGKTPLSKDPSPESKKSDPGAERKLGSHFESESMKAESAPVEEPKDRESCLASKTSSPTTPIAQPEAQKSLPEPEAKKSLPEPEAKESLPKSEAQKSLPEPEAKRSLPEPEAKKSLPEPEAKKSLSETKDGLSDPARVWTRSRPLSWDPAANPEPWLSSGGSVGRRRSPSPSWRSVAVDGNCSLKSWRKPESPAAAPAVPAAPAAPTDKCNCVCCGMCAALTYEHYGTLRPGHDKPLSCHRFRSRKI